MGNETNRYTADVKEASEISSFLDHAREELKRKISDSNAKAKKLVPRADGSYNVVSQDPTKVAGVSGSTTTSLRAVSPAPAPASENPFTFFPQEAPRQDDSSDLPKVNFHMPVVKQAEAMPVTPAIPTAPTEFSAPAPVSTPPTTEETIDLGDGEIFKPSVNRIETEVLTASDNSDFYPELFSTEIRTFPPNSEPPTTINVLTIHFGRAWVDWEPETMRQELVNKRLIFGDDTNAAERLLLDQVFAAQLLYSHTGFMDFWRMYEKICKAFNRKPVIMHEVQNAHPTEMTYFRKLTNILRPDVKNEKFGSEVLKYQAACSFSAGFSVAPKVLIDCQPDLDTLLATPEDPELKQTLHQSEDGLYNMSDDAFEKLLAQMKFDESPRSIQIARHMAVIRYVRLKMAAIKAQLKLG